MMVDEVFLKNKYRCILYLIAWSSKLNKKITFHHLKYALVKNYGGININDTRIKKNLEGFFKIPLKNKLPKYYNMLYKIGEINKDELNNMLSRNVLDELERVGWLTDGTKFSTVQNLNNYLSRIRKLDLIKIKKAKRGYPFYTMTQFGMKEYQKFYLKYLVDSCSVEKLDKLIEQFDKIFRES